MAGHANFKLLDGSWRKWTQEGHRLSKDIHQFSAVDYPLGPGDSSIRLGRDDIRDNLGSPGWFLLDVRSPEKYSGEKVIEAPKFDHGAKRGDRIPYAVHLFFKNLLNKNNTLKSEDELRAAFESVSTATNNADKIIVYCRLSRSVTFTWVVMTHNLALTTPRFTTVLRANGALSSASRWKNKGAPYLVGSPASTMTSSFWPTPPNLYFRAS